MSPLLLSITLIAPYNLSYDYYLNLSRNHKGMAIRESQVIGDLHIHSRYSRATSKDMNLDNLSHWGKIKGLNLLGTGDFTHPEWLKELKQKLNEFQEGVYEYKDMLYILQVEVNNAFSYEGKRRQVHNLIYAPSFDVVEQINELFSKHSNLKEDGRPTLKDYTCESMTEDLKNISKDIQIIPAHAWTPWFGIYGSKSGFNSIKECFGKEAKEIFAIETGLSSDPPMNAMVEETRNMSLISNSDAHSFWPWRLGREANIFLIEKEEITYNNIFDAIKNKKIITIEVDPAYGKYHYDGHRRCSYFSPPQESEKYKNLCPVCGKPLTLGVLHRVYDLSDGKKEEHEQRFYTLLPLHEIISKHLGTAMNSKAVWNVYNNIIKKFTNEYNLLLFADEKELERIEDRALRKLIIKNRAGKLEVVPGYDGEYGILKLDNVKESQGVVQRRLF